MLERVEIGDSRVPDRIWAKVEVQPSGCWHWTGYINPEGYGMVTGFRRSPTTGRLMPDFIYRIICDAVWGPAAPGIQHDHHCHNEARLTCPGGGTCEHRKCVNPAHMRRRVPRDNVLRGNGPSANFSRQETCVNDHALTPENSYQRPGKPHERACRRCKADRESQRYHHRMATDPEFRLKQLQRGRRRRKDLDPGGHARRIARDRVYRARKKAERAASQG